VPSWAGAAKPGSNQFSPADRADIKRIETYLNGLGTLRARFLQVSSNGDYAEGTLFVSRPGRLRIEYDPPVPVLMVAAGGMLTYYDRELQQVSHIDLNSTPAGILVRERISLFSEDITATALERGADALRMTVVRADDPLEGSIALVFSDRPLTLKKWTVTDAQGTVTTVSLLDTRFNVTLDPKLFAFEAPDLPGDDH
jgi:outer membrane lipoprotein-sorting protein